MRVEFDVDVEVIDQDVEVVYRPDLEVIVRPPLLGAGIPPISRWREQFQWEFRYVILSAYGVKRAPSCEGRGSLHTDA